MLAALPGVGDAQIAPYDDFRHTPRHYAPAAEAGDPQAMLYLGLALEALGPDAASRWGDARSWIAKAADAGLPEAQLRLAQIALAEGDRMAAARRLDAAATAGLPEAQFNRALVAAEDGDAALARRWYEAAAGQGFAPARFNLAFLYLDAERPVDALAMLILAAEGGVDDAAPARDALSAALSPEERAAAQALASEAP